MSLSNASSFRRMACGLCLLVGPLLLLAANIVDPVTGNSGSEREVVQALKDDRDMAELSIALYTFGFALVAIGLIGVVHVIRGRGVVLANLGGALALLGLILFAAWSAMRLGQLVTAEHLELDTAAQLTEDIQDYWALGVILGPALLGTLIGFLLLAAAIIRSRVAHVAAGVLIVAGSLLVTASEESRAIAIVANVLLLAGWGLVGLKLLGLKDEEWEGRVPIGAAGGPEASLAAPPPSV